MNNKYLSFCMTSLLLGGSMAVAAKQKAESANKKNVRTTGKSVWIS